MRSKPQFEFQKSQGLQKIRKESWGDSRRSKASMKRSQGKRKAESSRSSTKCGCGLGELDEWVMSVYGAAAKRYDTNDT